MRLIFVHLSAFRERMLRLRVNDEDLRSLEMGLLDEPGAGRVIPGTGGLRKLRFAPPSFRRGKSGACRVCYAWFPEADAIYFFTVYSKKDKENLDPSDKAYFRRTLEAYRRWMKNYKGVLP